MGNVGPRVFQASSILETKSLDVSSSNACNLDHSFFFRLSLVSPQLYGSSIINQEPLWHFLDNTVSSHVCGTVHFKPIMTHFTSPKLDFACLVWVVTGVVLCGQTLSCWRPAERSSTVVWRSITPGSPRTRSVTMTEVTRGLLNQSLTMVSKEIFPCVVPLL